MFKKKKLRHTENEIKHNKEYIDSLPIGSKITDEDEQEWEKMDDGKWYKLFFAYHYEDHPKFGRIQIVDVVGGKKVSDG